MNIGSLFDGAAYPQSFAAPLRRSARTAAASSFADKLPSEQGQHRFIQGPGFYPRLGENILCGGGAGTQFFNAEFTAASTEEDPIVRIAGTSDSGKFDFTRHICDIDPSNASYAELSVLNAWLRRTGAYQSSRVGALPSGMEPGDISRKQNFISRLRSFAASASQSGVYPKFNPEMYAYARELLGVYQSFSQGGTPDGRDSKI